MDGKQEETAVFEIPKGNFIFISYSHKDEKIVEEDIREMRRRGIRVWYDAHMRAGQNWEKIAKTIIQCPNCIGVVFYISGPSIASPNVRKEWLAKQAELAERKKTGGSYPHLLVFTSEVKDMFTKAIERRYYLNQENFSVQSVIELFNCFAEMYPDNNTLYIDRTASEEPEGEGEGRTLSEKCVDKIYKDLALPNGCVDNLETIVEALVKKKIMSVDTQLIRFGRYLDQPIGKQDQDTF